MATTPLPGVITRRSPFRTTLSLSSSLLSAHCVELDFFILKGFWLVLHFLPLSLTDPSFLARKISTWC